MNRNGPIVTDAVLEVFRTNGSLLAWGDRFAASYGLTSARWQMLGALALAGEPLTTPRIADNMGVTRQGARKQLTRLEADGLVRAHPNPHHQRSPCYQLTAKGERLYGEIDEAWRETADRIGEAVGVADLHAALRVLRLLRRHLPAPANQGES